MHAALVGNPVRDVRELKGCDVFIGVPCSIPPDLDEESLRGLLGGRVIIAGGLIIVVIEEGMEPTDIASNLIQLFKSRGIGVSLREATVPAAEIIAQLDGSKCGTDYSWSTPTRAYRIEPNPVEARLGLFAADHVLSFEK